MQSEPLYTHIISRKQARALGMKRYFTGKACLNGWVAQRQVTCGTCLCPFCLGKRKATNDSYLAANAERIAARQAAYRAANAQKIAAIEAAYRAANAEKKAAQAAAWRAANPKRAAALNAAYRAANAERIAARQAAYRAANAERIAARDAAYRAANPEKKAAQIAAWQAANPEKVVALSSKRRARKLQSIPGWASELDDLVFIEAADLARRRQQTTGIDWHVDHMIPLQALNACGFHCAANLQVIPARLNLQKGNKMVFTEPAEWLMEI